MKRRDLLKASLAVLAAPAVLSAQQQLNPPGAPAPAPPTAAPPVPSGTTPPAAAPRKDADPEPQVRDIEKYPRCAYCHMDRAKFHHSRMLIHYGDDVADPLCSLRCAATSFTLNLGRGPKAIWVADNAPQTGVKPLISVDDATFLISSKLHGVMTRRSKVAYGSADAAKASQAENGGELTDFDGALLAAYTDIAASVKRVRKEIEERRQRAAKPQG